MKLMKTLGLAAGFAAGLLAAPAMAQSALNDILSGGVLKVGTTGDWNPMSVRDPATNAYIGYDIDIMTQLATDLGVELEMVANFSGWDSINQPEVKVATTLGTSFEKMVKEWFPQAEIIVVEAPARGYQEVLSGRADVFVTSNIEGSELLQKFPNVRQVEVSAARAPTPIAMLLPQTDQVWINYINSWIELKKTEGFFEEVALKWGL